MDRVEIIGAERVCCASIRTNFGTKAVGIHQSKIDDDCNSERGFVTRFTCSGEGVSRSVCTPGAVAVKEGGKKSEKEMKMKRGPNW